MQKRTNFVPFFLVFFSLSLFLFFLGRFGFLNSFSSLLNKGANPLKISTINIFGFQNNKIEKLYGENQELRKKILDNQNLVLENKALKDQFANSTPRSLDLLPARVVGFPGFIPGVSNPDYLIIDKGNHDGVKKGSALILGNNLIGKVTEISNGYSKVELLNNKKASFTAKVTSMDGAEADGVIKGLGGEMSFENVLLTLSIKKGDIVLTKGDKDGAGNGYPPDLVIGKITSLEKKSSDLFQKAKVKSAVDFTNLRVVFVIR